MPSTKTHSESRERIGVSFVIDNMDVGGTELNAFRTAQRLDRHVFDVRVVCFRDGGPLTERYRQIGIPVTRIPLKGLYSAKNLSSGWRFVSFLKENRIRIVHAHDMYSNVFAVPWSRVAGARVIASRRWWHSLPNRRIQTANSLAFRFAHRVLANSASVAESVEQMDHVPQPRIAVIPNFADDHAFEPMDETRRTAERQRLGLGPDDFVIGCVARLVPVKDHVTLLHGFAAHSAKHRRSRLVIVGDGPLRGQLEGLSSSLGLGDSVLFSGEWLPDFNVHQLFDLSILTSLSEGFPNAVVEAMAARRPVIATSVGGTPDALTDAETGLLIPPGDSRAVETALNRLVEEPRLRREYADGAFAKAWERHRAQPAIASLEFLYRQLAGGHSA
jgi:glycosyltransferase involved in cell wall biosynthesis